MSFELEKNLETDELPIKDGNIIIADLTEEELQFFEQYIDITRFIQEIHQLYGIYCFNIEQMKKRVSIKGDCIYDMQCERGIDKITINALTNNIISAGKTLIDHIDTLIDLYFGDKKTEGKNHFSSDEYDDVFAFRFMQQMRNFSQHCHLSVSTEIGGSCYFDLDIILSTPHIKHNKSLLEEMKKIKTDIEENYNDLSHISYTQIMFDFLCSVFRVYYVYTKVLLPEIKTMYLTMQEKISDNQYWINKTENDKDFIIYKMEDDVAHCLLVNENCYNMFVEYKIEAKKNLKEYKKISKDIWRCV